MNVILIVAIAAISVGISKAEQVGSFYGSSFASLSLSDDIDNRTGVDTRFRFKTRNEDALLLLAASGTDYCLIELKGGTLKIRLKLGAYSKEFDVSPHDRYNDLKWHEVTFFYKASLNISITVDRVYRTYTFSTNGALTALDAPHQKSTVYVGGLGGYAGPLSTGRPPNLRGCLDSLYYNGVNVFQKIISLNRKAGGVLYEVEFTHTCPAEFEATNQEAISFLDTHQSFVALPSLQGCPLGFQLNMQFQTIASRGVLAFQSGRRSVLALEIEDGYVHLIFNSGDSLVTVRSPTQVNDGQWHKLQIDFNENATLTLHVDQTRKSIPGTNGVVRGGHREWLGCEFDSHFYVGGIDARNRAKASAQGVHGAHTSLPGCVHYMRLNGKPIGLENVLLSKAIDRTCKWKYACFKDPCIPKADCLQVGIDSFQCVCDQTLCTKEGFTANYKETFSSVSNDDGASEKVLAVAPLIVQESGSEYLSTDHIQLLVDHHKLGIKGNDIMFSVLVPPVHGVFYNDRIKNQEIVTFTYRDIERYRVRYTHDGSESSNDTIVLEMSVNLANSQNTSAIAIAAGQTPPRIPQTLSQKLQFMLHIAIIAQQSSQNEEEDPLGSTRNYDSRIIFNLARYTRKALSTDMFNIEDIQYADEKAAMFQVHILDPDNTGFLENVKNPGMPLEEFSTHELSQNAIWFIHRGKERTGFALTYTSPTITKEVFVDVRTFPLEITLVNNTGVKANYVTPVAMNNQMLAFITNAPEQMLDIRFDIVQPPKYGHIERLKANTNWMSTTHFSQRQLIRQKVRYVPAEEAITEKPDHDVIGFVVSCEKVKVSTVYTFKLDFTKDSDDKDEIEEHRESTFVGKGRITSLTNNTRVLTDTRQVALTEKDIKYVDENDARLTYTLASTPKLGKILLNGVVLGIGSNFTQRHLAQKNMVYRPSKSVIFFEDRFIFNVTSAHATLSNQVFTFRSSNSNSVIVANMRVPEGERLALKLSKQSFTNEGYIIKIISGPDHGQVERQEGKQTFNVVKEFPVDAVAKGDIYYHHDDTETLKDHFKYELIKQTSGDVTQVGDVIIDISLKNDNPPKRTQEQVFHIATSAEKVLTNYYLRYEDVDSDTDPSKITYNSKEIPNAILVRNDDSRKEITQFTQRDIDNEMILVRHTGGDYGRAIFWISDGQFYANGILEIVASDPYLNITTNTGLLIEQGESALILSSNLSIDTNLNVKPSDIIFKVSPKPKLGRLRFTQNINENANKFTMRDIQEGLIEYVHTSKSQTSFEDCFNFTVTALSVSTQSSFKITAFPAAFWAPMVLKAGGNKTMFVDVGRSTSVARAFLSVLHESLQPEDIIFTVIRKPKYGHLALVNSNEASASTFSQADVNKGQLRYTHTGGSAGMDSFAVDATNGFTQISGIEVHIQILSRVLSLRTQNLTVNEGASVTITMEYLSLPGGSGGTMEASNLGIISEYIIIEPAKHGMIVTSKDKNIVNSFTPEQLRKGQIEYSHSGDESLTDWFTVVARAGLLGKESSPATIHVRINPVNDEQPVIVENTGLELWEGEWAIITAQNLAAFDEDTPADDLRYQLSTPSNGFVAYINQARTPILSFTQAEINRNVIVFAHTGADTGGFRFQVDDGVNYAPHQEFIVKAKQIQVQLLRNERLRVEPNGQQSITPDHLFSTTSLQSIVNASNIEITYMITRLPLFGRILLEKLDGTLEPINEFTQDQIDQTLVLYENMRQAKNDSFLFSVSTNRGKLQKEIHIFAIDITSKSIIDSPVVLQAREGDLVAIPVDVMAVGNVLPKCNISLIRPPKHGWIGLDGPKGVEPTEHFTNDDLNHGRVWYSHDDSETIEDTFMVSLQNLVKKVEPLNISILIDVEPVNDQPPILKTINPQVDVIEGQSTMITVDLLLTEDADNISSQVIYNFDYTESVAFSKNDTSPVWAFSQQDIDENKISISCNTSEANSLFEIPFNVDDGVHDTIKSVLSVLVKAPTLKLSKNQLVVLTQGSFFREITNFELEVETNGNREDIVYNIIKAPENGHIHLDGENASQFRQADIDVGLVQYVQVANITTTDDFFITDVHCRSAVLRGIRVNISVIALVNQEKLLEVPLANRGVIGRRHLDASKIAKKHQTNPRFHITRKPNHGVIGKLGVGAVEVFTHEDVLNSLVYYESKGGSAPSEDSFEFKLSSPGVQPGKGQLIIVITPRTDSADMNTIPGGNAISPQPTDATNTQTTGTVPTIEPTVSTTSVSLLELDRTQVHQVILLLSMVAVAIIIISIAFVLLLCKVLRITTSGASCKSQGGGSNSSTYVSNSGYLENMDDVDRFVANAVIPPPPPPIIPGSACRMTGMQLAAEPSIDYNSSIADGSDCVNDVETDSKEGGTSSPIPVLRKNQYWV